MTNTRPRCIECKLSTIEMKTFKGPSQKRVTLITEEVLHRNVGAVARSYIRLRMLRLCFIGKCECPGVEVLVGTSAIDNATG